jgi:hypothetical protein
LGISNLEPRGFEPMGERDSTPREIDYIETDEKAIEKLRINCAF